MKHTIALILIPLSLMALSCSKTREEELIGLWQETAVINPQLDQTIRDQAAFSDSVGRSTDADANLALYGTSDIDSFRIELKNNLDAYRKAQSEAVNATKFDFRKGGIMYIHSGDGLDSSNWYLDEDGALVLDEAKLKGTGSKISMQILDLSDTSLKLQYTEKFLSSTAVFKPVKK